MEKILLFGVTDTKYNQIKQIAGRMKIRCEQVVPACYSHTLEQLLSSNTTVPNVSGSTAPIMTQGAAESLLVMCGLSDKRMDKLLFELRRSNVTLDYKAVLTPTNRNWTVSQLLLEMRREKAAYRRMQP